MEAQNQFTIQSEKKNIDELTEEQKKQLSTNLVDIVSLKGNSYSKTFFSQLSDSLTKSNNLERMNLNDIFVGRGKDEIPHSINFLSLGIIGKPIQKIDISNNAINPFGAEALKPFLKQADSLKVFLINNCGLGIHGVTHIAQGLAEGAHNLEILAIARNRAEDQGALQLSQTFASFKNFKELHIYQNGIKEEGMIPLLKSLIDNCVSLEVLDVRDNFIHENTAPVLAELISKSSNLTALNISDSNLESKYNESILEALEKTSVKFERLGYNYAELSDDQGNRLLDIVVKNITQLQKFDIKGNNFKKVTKQRFRQAFQQVSQNKVLSVFDSEEEDDNDAADELAREFSVLKI